MNKPKVAELMKLLMGVARNGALGAVPSETATPPPDSQFYAGFGMDGDTLREVRKNQGDSWEMRMAHQLNQPRIPGNGRPPKSLEPVVEGHPQEPFSGWKDHDNTTHVGTPRACSPGRHPGNATRPLLKKPIAGSEPALQHQHLYETCEGGIPA